MGRNFPYYYLQEAQASVDSYGLDLSGPFNTQTATELAIRDIPPDLRSPYIQMWRLELENSLSNDWTVNVEYFGRRGVHELRIIPGNVPLPGPGPLQPRRPNTDYGQFSIVSGGGSSIHHQLGIEVQRRFARGLSFQSEFGRGKRLDDEFEGDPSNPRNLRTEWAPTEWYQDKRLSVRLETQTDRAGALERGTRLGTVTGLARRTLRSPTTPQLGPFTQDLFRDDVPVYRG